MFTVRTEPHRLINPALSTLGRYLTASLHSRTNLFDLAEAEQVVTFPDVTLLRGLISFPVYFGLHYFRRQLALHQGNKSLHARPQGIHNPLNRRRHSIH